MQAGPWIGKKTPVPLRLPTGLGWSRGQESFSRSGDKRAACFPPWRKTSGGGALGENDSSPRVSFRLPTGLGWPRCSGPLAARRCPSRSTRYLSSVPTPRRFRRRRPAGIHFRGVVARTATGKTDGNSFLELFFAENTRTLPRNRPPTSGREPRVECYHNML